MQISKQFYGPWRTVSILSYAIRIASSICACIIVDKKIHTLSIAAKGIDIFLLIDLSSSMADRFITSKTLKYASC